MKWKMEDSWHLASTAEAIERLASDEQSGLSSAEAAERLREVGPNEVPAQKGPSAFVRFLQQFQNPLVYVLLVSGAVTVVLPGHLVDAAVIFGVVLLNAIAGFVQEERAKAAIDALSQFITVKCVVVRDGRPQETDAVNLVPGDIVTLQTGDRVPADLRLLHLRNLQVDESMLTGESVPVAKDPAALDHDYPMAERVNMAYSGTLVTSGQATGLVVATGAATELGRISGLIAAHRHLATPLTKRIGQFSTLLSWVIVALALATFAVGLLVRQMDPVDTFVAAVALAVAAIPEGLPAAMTIILAIGVTRMARRHAIIRKLPAVETLGSTSVICTDKTGTLTRNEMTVTALVAAGARYDFSGIGYQPEGALAHEGGEVGADHAVPLRQCLQAGVLCNDSRVVEAEGLWRVEGDPTEGALLTAAAKAGLAAEDLRAHAPRLDVIPFESEHQYMASLHVLPEGERVVYVKGAVEKVLALCSQMCLDDGELVPLEAPSLHEQADRLAAEGLRVLAFAMKPARADQNHLHDTDVASGLIFLGLQGMIDPPRPEAIAAVSACRRAGVTVKMITGDHVLTARTIARQIGIGGEDPRALTGVELAEVAVENLPEVAASTDVFARVAPEQKLRLVEALQARGAVVAMTGDGVNDAPALKQANIGIAMGITGTEVAKDVADMVLTDDNFASIEAAVEEGRGVFDNLRKFIAWTLPTNGGEGLLILTAIALGVAIPVLPVQVLWINMTTALALGMMLAFEPKEAGLMLRPARKPDEPILTRLLLFRVLYVSVLMVIGAFGLFEWEQYQGLSLEEARTIAMNVIVLVELMFLFNCRSLTHPVTTLGFRSNPWVLLGVVLMILLQVLVIYVPAMQRLFGTAPIGLEAWLHAAGVGLIVYFVVELEKRLTRHRVLGG